MDWTLFKHGVFLVNLLGIIYDPKTKMVLIGKRVNDPNIKNLSWVFPGGRPDYKDDLELNLIKKIKEDTGLKIELTDFNDIVFAKTYPEKREFLSIYYHIELNDKAESALPGGSLSELKWVEPSEVTKYFTTSLHPVVLNYLKTLE